MSDAAEADGSGRGSTGGTGPTRRSVEVEYWVIDDDGRLTDPRGLVDASPGVEREFVSPLLEIKTTPCESTAELREELFDRVGRVLRRADELDKGLVPLATPIHDGEIADRESERTRIQDRVVGDRFEYVRHCAGTHVHIEQRPGHAVDQLNTLTALDPALALVSSSPYFEREPLAASARSVLYRRLAYEHLPKQGKLWPYLEDTEEWARRLERRYEAFVTEAIASGCDRETVEGCFIPEGAVWVPVKLRAAFSTVEWRSPDTALPSQVVRLADDLVEAVDRGVRTEVRIEGDTGRVTDDAVVLPSFDAVEEHVEAAVRDGLDSEAVRSYLGRMGFDVDAYDPLSAELRGAGALSAAEARETRIDYADRLKRDIGRRQAVSGD
ncbi:MULTISPECIES: glutamate-cysteine ligase family protein [Halorubrum]|uniref:Glutamate--cysteine ligase n=1 Tax=Halorubrum ruber TaxID=2982524 RepID=A0A8T8LNF2_9EURY|nr:MULTISPECIES: glutamate-cysteine ligase family protein [Halorubrum]QUO47991.1 glutamate--cysteine ligase [Halorubrum ruber]